MFVTVADRQLAADWLGFRSLLRPAYVALLVLMFRLQGPGRLANSETDFSTLESPLLPLHASAPFVSEGAAFEQSLKRSPVSSPISLES